MGEFNHGYIQWKSLESAGGDDHQFLLLTQDCFFTQQDLEPTRGRNVLKYTNLWVQVTITRSILI